MRKEKSYPRERFTQSLYKICQRLQRGPQICAVQTRSFIDHSIVIKKIQVKSLWVAGSYARGAIECGDLDLIIDVESLTGSIPYAHQIARSLFGATPLVSFYTGTPENNTSGVVFKEALLIWNIDQPNWENILQNIPVSSDVVRFERPSDRLPLSTRQFYFDSEAVDKLLALYDAKIIQWTFSSINFNAKNKPELSLHMQNQLKYKNCGMHSGVALHHFFAIEPQQWEDQHLYGTVRDGFYIAGVNLNVGKSKIPSNLLESMNIYQEILIPHLSNSGPNGAWIVERGEKHPLIIQANQYYGYVLICENIIQMVSESDEYNQSKLVLEIYDSLDIAEDLATYWNDDSENSPPLKVISISGREFLNEIAKAEYVDIYQENNITRFELDKIYNGNKNIQALHHELFSLLPSKRTHE
ncbi:hypothetical protein [Acinetobacter ihumii]|uniref:hypothetical protein n=1 Tax=Acinetobacter ihumii TaxID=2483802 RepID=UPI0010301E42|nr:hypothetical protein [Acinetobacter ihumii]